MDWGDGEVFFDKELAEKLTKVLNESSFNKLLGVKFSADKADDDIEGAEGKYEINAEDKGNLRYKVGDKMSTKLMFELSKNEVFIDMPSVSVSEQFIKNPVIDFDEAGLKKAATDCFVDKCQNERNEAIKNNSSNLNNALESLGLDKVPQISFDAYLKKEEKGSANIKG